MGEEAGESQMKGCVDGEKRKTVKGDERERKKRQQISCC